MAWSPFQRANAGIIWVEQPGDYANPIPTAAATGPQPATYTLLVSSRRATQRAWRLPGDAYKALTHPFGVRKAYRACNRFERLSTVLHHRTCSLHSQALNRLGRGHTRRRNKGPAELPKAQMGDLG